MQQHDWFVGVGWGKEIHQACVLDVDGAVLGERGFSHGGEGLAAMGAWTLEMTEAAADVVAVAIETPRGPVVGSLMAEGFAVHSMNPRQLDRHRDRFSPAGAKDDRRDARVLADALRTSPDSLRELAPADPLAVQLRESGIIAANLVRDRIRHVHRLRQHLWDYYPQFVGLVGDDLGKLWTLKLWALATTPEKARRLRRTTVERMLKSHRIRRVGADEIIGKLREQALVVNPGVAEAAVASIRTIAASLTLMQNQLDDVYRRIDRLIGEMAESGKAGAGQNEEQRDVVTILSSMPGIGRIVLAALLAEAYDPLQRRDYHALRCLCGTAPVTKRSGKSTMVVRRLASHHRLRYAVYHWTRVAIQHDPASRSKYAALRAKGHGHGRALRSVADRLLAVACAMLRDQTLFDPEHSRKIQDN